MLLTNILKDKLIIIIQNNLLKMSSRPDFMTPTPVSPKRRSFNDLVSSRMKRTFSQAFQNDKEEEHYGQEIGNTFFVSNIGHCVIDVQEDMEQREQREQREREREQQEEHRKNVFQEAADNVCQDFRSELGNLRRERDCESKYDVEEIIAWCDYYLKNRNIFNV